MVNRRLRTSQKVPAAGLGLQFLSVAAQNLWGVFRRIHRKRDEMDVRFFERLLQFTHSTADHGARSVASGVNEVGDPDFAAQLSRTEILSVLVHQDKFGDRSVRRNRALPKRSHFQLSQPKQERQRENWNRD